MSQQKDHRLYTAFSGEGFERGTRLRLAVDQSLYTDHNHSGDGLVFTVAGSADRSIATGSRKAFTAGETIAVRLHQGGTSLAIAAGIIDAGAQVYAADNGRVSASGTVPEGFAMEAATDYGDIIEVMFR